MTALSEDGLAFSVWILFVCSGLALRIDPANSLIELCYLAPQGLGDFRTDHVALWVHPPGRVEKEHLSMCVSCACGSPNDDHGDKRNITMNQLEQAAEAANIGVDEVCQNIDAAGAETATAGAGAERE